MNAKHFTISLFLIGILTFSILSVPTVSGAASSDVHGISYRDGSALRLGVLPNTVLAYTNVDWYVYHNGSVEVLVNNEPTETLTVDGLLVYKQTYQPDSRMIISFRLDSGKTFTFNLDVRSSISYKDLEDNPINYITMSEDEFSMKSLQVGLASAAAVAIAFYLMYRHRRRANRKGVRHI